MDVCVLSICSNRSLLVRLFFEIWNPHLYLFVGQLTEGRDSSKCDPLDPAFWSSKCVLTNLQGSLG